MTQQSTEQLADVSLRIIAETLKARCRQHGIETKHLKHEVLVLIIKEEYDAHLDEALKDAKEAFGVNMPAVGELTFKMSMVKAGNKVFDRYMLIVKTQKKEAKKEELNTPSGV